MRCPTCKGTAEESEHRPFCSVRCKDIDLSHWLNGDYCISSPLPPEELDKLGEERPRGLFD